MAGITQTCWWQFKISSLQSLESPFERGGKPRNHAGRCETLRGLGICDGKKRHTICETGCHVLWSGSSFRRILGSSCGICSQTRRPVLQSQLRQRGLQPDPGRIQGVIMSLLNEVQKFIEAHPGCTSGDIADAFAGYSRQRVLQ